MKLRGHIKLKLIRELATAEESQTVLAKRYGVTQSTVSAFGRRHAEAIAEVRGKLDDEFAGLWAAKKVNRIAEYQEQIERVAEILDSKAVGSSVPTAEMMRTAQSALRAIADELGQIPTRVQMQHGGSLDVRINGVDVANLL